MLEFLKNGRTITLCGLAFLGLTIAFAVWIEIYDLSILDEISDPEEIRARLAAMSPSQMTSHWWMTLLLDYAYPLAYGGFFAGLALRFFGKAGLLLAVPAFIAIPADMIENTLQLFILTGQSGLIEVKSVVTPIKLVSFLIAALIALIALIIAAVRRFGKTREA